MEIFVQIAAKKRLQGNRKKSKQERKFHVNSLKRFDLQKKKPANHKLNHTLFILKEN